MKIRLYIMKVLEILRKKLRQSKVELYENSQSRYTVTEVEKSDC